MPSNTVKMFHAITALPRTWMDAVGATAGQQEAHLVVLGFTKGETEALLTDRGMPQVMAASSAGSLRRNAPFQVVMLIDAGVIDPATPNAYAYYSAVEGQPVVRIDRFGTVEVVAHFHYDDAERVLWVEPVNA